MSKSSGKLSYLKPTTEEIRALAYQLWLKRGGQHGNDSQDWFEAERQLIAQRQATAIRQNKTASSL